MKRTTYGKKGQEMSVGILVLIVLGIVVLVTLLIGFTMGWENFFEKIAKISGDKQKFNITKTECHNSTILLPENARLYVIQSNDSMMYFKAYISASTVYGVRYGYDYEVCKDKEYLYIILNEKKWLSCVDFCALSASSIDSCVKPCANAMAKEDLTKEWLNSNAKCIQVTANHWNYKNTVDYENGTGFIPKEIFEDMAKGGDFYDCGYDSCFEEGFWECSKWNLGEYTVEELK